MGTWAADWMNTEQPGNRPVTALVRQPKSGRYALRPLPNEDIALWVKSIDNTRVEQTRDPGVSKALWRYIGGAVAAVALVVGLLLPGAYNWLAGYQLNKLEASKKELTEQRDLLRLQQAHAESPKQLEQWAAEYHMSAPDSTRLVYLQPKDTKRAVAERRMR
jgi:hypothetical protein